jgi:serine/threonine-protein phosphatase 2A regulatory subunit A
MCFKWLNDSVYSIRVASIENLKQLTVIFGSKWAEKNIITRLLDLKTEGNYLHRLTALFGMAELSKILAPEVVKKSFVPVLQTMSKDPIPNIRLNVAKTIFNIRQMYMVAQ